MTEVAATPTSTPTASAPKSAAPEAKGFTAPSAQAQLDGKATAEGKTPFELPDELDLDSLDEQMLKKLQNWKKKVKINGQERQVSLLDTIRYAQKEMAADEKMQKASTVEKQQKALIEALRNNPTAVLERLGYDVDELAKNRIAERLQREAMSPEQREVLAAREEAERYKQALLEQEQTRQQRLKMAGEQMAREKWQKSLVGALEKSGLPANELVMKLTAQFVLANHKKGYTDFTAEDAIPMVRDYCVKMAKFYFNQVPPQDLFRELGSEFDGKVRKFLLEQVQNPIKEGFKQTPKGSLGSDGAKRNERKFMTADEYRAQLDKKF